MVWALFFLSDSTTLTQTSVDEVISARMNPQHISADVVLLCYSILLVLPDKSPFHHGKHFFIPLFLKILLFSAQMFWGIFLILTWFCDLFFYKTINCTNQYFPRQCGTFNISLERCKIKLDCFSLIFFPTSFRKIKFQANRHHHNTYLPDIPDM